MGNSISIVLIKALNFIIGWIFEIDSNVLASLRTSRSFVIPGTSMLGMVCPMPYKDLPRRLLVLRIPEGGHPRLGLVQPPRLTSPLALLALVQLFRQGALTVMFSFLAVIMGH